MSKDFDKLATNGKHLVNFAVSCLLRLPASGWGYGGYKISQV
jgi:hypothetical protein